MVLVHSHSVQPGLGQLGRKAVPDGYGQVLSGRNPAGKFRNFFVQEAVVHGIEYFVVHDFFQLFQIDDEPGAWIDLALNRDLEQVIVPMSVGVVALPEQTPVLFRRKLRIVVVMRGGKFSFAGEIEQGTFSIPFRGAILKQSAQAMSD